MPGGLRRSRSFAMAHRSRVHAVQEAAQPCIGSNRCGLEDACAAGRSFADFLNGRRNDRGAVLRMAELQMHAAADERGLQHGPAPVGAEDAHQDRPRTKLRMSGNQRQPAAAVDYRVGAMPGLDLEAAARLQLAEVHPALDLRLGDVVINAIAQVGMGRKEMDIRRTGFEFRKRPPRRRDSAC